MRGRCLLLLGCGIAVAWAQPESVPGRHLTTGDRLEMKVYQEAELDGELRVDAAGVVRVPLIGEVKVEGLELKEAEALLEQRLADGYLVKPDVTLAVKEYAQRSFSILGEVAKPGYYELPKGESVSLGQAVALAGGFTDRADPARIEVVRKAGGGERREVLSLEPGAAGAAFRVEAQDAIVVGYGNRRYSVVGQVAAPGYFELRPQERVTVWQAISLAGGATPEADLGRVALKRGATGAETVVLDLRPTAPDPAQRNLEMRPEDVLNVPYASRSFSVLGQVQKPGQYVIPPETRMTLPQAIAQAGGFTKIADQGKILVQREVDGQPATLRLSFKDRSPERSVVGFEVQPGDVITVAESLF